MLNFAFATGQDQEILIMTGKNLLVHIWKCGKTYAKKRQHNNSISNYMMTSLSIGYDILIYRVCSIFAFATGHDQEILIMTGINLLVHFWKCGKTYDMNRQHNHSISYYMMTSLSIGYDLFIYRVCLPYLRGMTPSLFVRPVALPSSSFGVYLIIYKLWHTVCDFLIWKVLYWYHKVSIRGMGA